MGGSALSSPLESELNACAKDGKEWMAGARSDVGGGMVPESVVADVVNLLFVARANGESRMGVVDAEVVVVVVAAGSVPVAVDDERKDVRTEMVRVPDSVGFGCVQGLVLKFPPKLHVLLIKNGRRRRGESAVVVVGDGEEMKQTTRQDETSGRPSKGTDPVAKLFHQQNLLFALDTVFLIYMNF